MSKSPELTPTEPLPPPPVVERESASNSSTFACPACHITSAAVEAEAASGQSRRDLLRLGLAIFFAMNVMVFTMAMWSRNIYVDMAETDPIAGSLYGLFRYLALLFSIPVLFLLGGPILSRVWQALSHGRITTDLLILLGVAAAYLYSVVTVVRSEGHVYFEVGCMVLIFVSIGRWLEASGKHKTVASLDALAKLLPDMVRRVRGTSIEQVNRNEVAVDDVLQVLPGERFAIDGTLLEGTAEVDEQILTGESRTTTKNAGDTVFSGTHNLDGDLRVKVTAAAGQETVSRMLKLVRQARDAKGRHARLADRVAAWFVPAVFLLAIATAVGHGMESGFDVGMLAGLSVVLIACPCALGLATPMAVWTALGRAAQVGVLFRSGQTLEDLAAVRAVRFDKTGTLTSGEPRVAEFIALDDGDANHDALCAAMALAQLSSHGLSQAICREVGDIDGSDIDAAVELTEVETRPGKGIVARMKDGSELVSLGSRRLMDECGFDFDTALAASVAQAGADHAPLSCIGWGGKVRGVFIFEEELRPQATSALARCQELNLDAAVLTGDHRLRAAEVEGQLGVPVAAELLPEDKVAEIESAKKMFGSVAMVGDGLNDAPALAAADVGIAMGCGADLSRESADVCLLSDELNRFGWAVELARQTVHIIRQNLFWAFAYNAVGIGFAVTGKLNPVWAALAMALSSFFVVSNSLRLSRFPLGDLSESLPVTGDSLELKQDNSFQSAPASSHPEPVTQ